MTRIRSALVSGAALLLLAGCGSGEASQGDVEEEVTDILLEDGYEGQTFDEAEASDAARCIAQTMFESDDFTEDERNEVASAADGDRPSEELTDKVIDLVDGCLGEPATSGPEAPAEDE
jgi:hypothetical protein